MCAAKGSELTVIERLNQIEVRLGKVEKTLATIVQARQITEPGTLATSDDVSARQSFLDSERAKWLTVKEAAYILRTSLDTIFRLLHDKKLSGFRDGRVIRIHVDALVHCQKVLEEWTPAKLKTPTRR